MPAVPFSGQLDLCVACLLVLERHGALARRSLTAEDVARDVLETVDRLEVAPRALAELDAFEDAVDGALARLVRAGWVSRRNYHSVVRYSVPTLGEDALAWIRARLAQDPHRAAELDALRERIARIVLARYGDDAEVDAPAARPSSRD